MTDHVWTNAVPGQGSQQVCKFCGTRKISTAAQMKCPGADREVALQTVHDYDPFGDADV